MVIDRKIIFCDIDNTICSTEGLDYENAVPIPRIIHNMNWLHDQGHTVVYYTARGTGLHVDFTQLTKQQLRDWGCHYSLLRMDKPLYDVFVDDRTIRPQAVIWKERMPPFARKIFPTKGDLYAYSHTHGR